jgi:hypothetical protein
MREESNHSGEREQQRIVTPNACRLLETLISLSVTTGLPASFVESSFFRILNCPLRRMSQANPEDGYISMIAMNDFCPKQVGRIIASSVFN